MEMETFKEAGTNGRIMLIFRGELAVDPRAESDLEPSIVTLKAPSAGFGNGPL
jgi:hypothetical protein